MSGNDDIKIDGSGCLNIALFAIVFGLALALMLFVTR